jgi:hypothetical protein
MRKQLIALVLTPILAISSAQAADAVRWVDLPKKIGTGKAREYTVTTRDGNTKKGTTLAITPTGIQLGDSSPIISREEVAQVRVHHHQHILDAAGAPTESAFADSGEGWLISPVMIPFMCVVYAATAPPAMAVEAVRRMLPDKVIKVAP